MPVSVWLAIHESGDLNKLIIKGFVKPEILSKAWSKCYDEYIKEFGVNDRFKEFLELKRSLIYWTCEHAINPESINETMLKMSQAEHDTFFDNEEKGSFGKAHSRLQKYQGYPMPLNTTTVYEFYNNVRTMNEDLQEQIRRKNKHQIEDEG